MLKIYKKFDFYIIWSFKEWFNVFEAAKFFCPKYYDIDLDNFDAYKRIVTSVVQSFLEGLMCID